MAEFKLRNWNVKAERHGTKVHEADITFHGHAIGDVFIEVRRTGEVWWESWMKTKNTFETSDITRVDSLCEAVEAIKCWIDEVG